jgi:hypothetical protein
MATTTPPTPRRPLVGRHRLPTHRRVLVTIAEGIVLAVFHLPLVTHAGLMLVLHLGRSVTRHRRRWHP